MWQSHFGLFIHLLPFVKTCFQMRPILDTLYWNSASHNKTMTKLVELEEETSEIRMFIQLLVVDKYCHKLSMGL